MKKLLILLLLSLSLGLYAERGVVVEWDDTVTVRDVNNLDSYRIVNSNYQFTILPTGLDPNLEIFIYRQLSEMPPVDYRIYNVLVSEGCIDSLDVTWSTNRIYARQFSIIERDSTELFESVEQEENLANANVFPYEKQFKYLLIYVNYLERKIDGLSIPSTVQTVADKVNDKGELIYQNYVNAQAKKEAIRNEESFDIDLGWNDSNPE